VKLEGVRELPTTPEQLWKILMDPEALARCLPGCESLEATGENTFAATLKVGIAAIKGSYKGTLSLSNLQPPKSCDLEVQGSGASGFVQGKSKIELSSGEKGTDLHYVADLQVGGLIASVGQRMVHGIATTLMHQFFKALEDEVRAQTAPDKA
jgi:carbon monoxide dehydrogenase subunit G